MQNDRSKFKNEFIGKATRETTDKLLSEVTELANILATSIVNSKGQGIAFAFVFVILTFDF